MRTLNTHNIKAKVAEKPKTSLAAGLAVMAAIATPVYVSWEGTKQTPYQDIVGVWTVCSGDTRNVTPGQRQTPEQCEARTSAIMEEFGTGVARMSPGIEDSPFEFAAHTIFSANIGLGAYSRSSIRSEYNKGNFVESCRRMKRYDKAGGRVVRGLVFRRHGEGERIGEHELCVVGAVPRELKK